MTKTCEIYWNTSEYEVFESQATQYEETLSEIFKGTCIERAVHIVQSTEEFKNLNVRWENFENDSSYYTIIPREKTKTKKKSMMQVKRGDAELKAKPNYLARRRT